MGDSNRCLCGMHVHDAALCISIFGLLMSFDTGFFTLPAYLCLLVGRLTRSPMLYWVYLLLQAVYLCLMPLIIIGFYLSGFGKMAQLPEHATSQQSLPVYLLFGAGSVLLLSWIWEAYITTVVYRAYKYIKECRA